MADLDICVTDVLNAQLLQRPLVRRRVFGKQCDTPDNVAQRVRAEAALRNLARSYEAAWQDYKTKHVVSMHAAKLITHFCAGNLAESLEVEDVQDAPGDTRERPVIDI